MEYPNITAAQVSVIENEIRDVERACKYQNQSNKYDIDYLQRFIRALESYSFICPAQRIRWSERLERARETP